jgi:hypothetical protein
MTTCCHATRALLGAVRLTRNGTGTSLYLATLAPVALGDGQSMRVVIKMPKWGISPDEMREVSEEIEHEVRTIWRYHRLLEAYSAWRALENDNCCFLF